MNPAPKPRKKKKKSKRWLKKKAWDWFSKYIRLKASDGYGFAECVTCKEKKHWKDMQAGHFIPSRCNSILFEENGVHAQCARCNYNEGNGPEYFVFMEKTYGREEIDRLRGLRHQQRKFTDSELLEMAEYYENKAAALLKGIDW